MGRTCLSIGVIAVLGCSVSGQSGPAFSELPIEQQHELRAMVEPPEPHARYGGYSTPMYYLMHEGFDYDGSMDTVEDKRTYIKDKPGPDHGSWVLDRNRPDWQEQMIRDWAELGLNSTHLNIYPINNELHLRPSVRQALVDFVRLSEKHGLKVGVRLDALGAYAAWEMHPGNRDNKIDEYLGYVREVATLLKGKVLYYVMGDEMTLHQPAADLDPKLWTPDVYLTYFKRLSAAIKSIDPDVKVSMFGASSGEWFNVVYLLKTGYAQHGDAVAINHYDYNSFPKFYAQAQELAPGLMFLSNGVGYHSTATAEPRYPQGDPYSRHGSEQAHGLSVAKTMFVCWDLALDAAPYYITLRNWNIRGRVYPRWFGFFGFTDFVVDEYDNMTVKRYPAWYAYQTIAHTFYNRDKFKTPSFKVTAAPEVSMLRSFVHDRGDGKELLIMLWNDKGPASIKLSIESSDYQYAVRANLFNFRKWDDVLYAVGDDGVSMDLQVDHAPVILRLFSR